MLGGVKMQRCTFKKSFDRHNGGKLTTTMNVTGYTQHVENVMDSSYPESIYYLSGEAVDKLSSYEDAEEAGLIKIPPCNVGDYVYQLDRQHNIINTKKVKKIIFEVIGRNQNRMEIIFETAGHCFDSCFGKTVFSNKVEAMHALQKGSI